MSGTLQLAGCAASTLDSSPSATRHNALLIPEKLWLKGPQQEPVWQPQQIVYRGPIKPAMLKAEANRSYSWWWDSHVSPKNSRWLQENLTDMDMKVKAMLKLIEEDADSFAQRAEMYYKKRPELVNLVEEFYRAYRALAERYDHISGELRQVHYSMAEASPIQIQSLLHGDSPRAFAMTEACNQYFENRQTAQSFNDADELLKETSDQQRGLHFQMHKKTGFPFEETEASNEMANLQGLQPISEISQRDPEKMASPLQEELHHVKEENQKIKKVSSSQVEQINGLKDLVLSLKEQNKGLEQEGNALRLKLQTENQELRKLKTEIQNLEVGLKNIEKLEGIQYEDITQEHGVQGNEISSMHNRISQLQQENHRLSVQVMTGARQLEKAQKEAHNLHEALLKSHAEQEAMILQHQESHHLYQDPENRMNDLQARISLLQEENKRLKDELSSGILHFKIIEERAQNLERDKKALQQEMEHRAQKTSLLQEELTAKHKEEKNLIIRLQEETAQSRRMDTDLKTCQQALSQSQEQQKILTGELHVGIERLKDANTNIKKLEEEITQHRKENDILLKQISSAVMSVKNLEEENSKLKQDKSTLLNEVAFRVDQRNALQQELYCLQEERNDLDRKFQTITKQIEPLGIDVEYLQSYFTSLQNDNQKLREDCHKCEEEKVSMAKIAQKKEEELIERKQAVENIVSSHKAEVQRLEDKMKQLELLFHGLQEEKTSLMIENKQHTEHVKVLEASLQNVNRLNSQLEGENLYLNGKMTDALWHVKQLEEELCSLQCEKEATENEIAASAIQVSDLEQKIHLLQEGGKDLMTRLQEETDKQNKSQIELENSQQLLCQLEDRIKTQSAECQEHIEEYRSAVEKVTELEKVIHIQQKEIDSLLNDLSSQIKLNMELELEMEKLGDLLAIPDTVNGQLEGVDVRSTKLFNSIFDKIKSLQIDLSHTEEENKRLLNEALASGTCLEQFKMNMSALLSENESLEAEGAIRSHHFEKMPREIPEFQNITEALRIKLHAGIERERKLKLEVKSVQQSLVTSQGAHLTLQDEHQRTIEECNSAKKQIDDLQCSHSVLEQEGQVLLTEALTQINLVSILESISVEKDEQIQILVEKLNKLHEEKQDLVSKVQNGDKKVQMLEVETLQLQEAIGRLQEHKKHTDVLRSEFKTLSEECQQMNIQIQTGNRQVKEKDKMLHKLRQQLQAVQEDNARLVQDFGSVKEEYAAVEMTVKELQKQLSLLTEETIHLNAEVSVGRKDRAKLEEELDNLQCQKQKLCDKLSSSVMNENKLQKDVMQLQEQREHSRIQLQKRIIEIQILEGEAERLYESLLSSQIENTLLKDENQKITDACKSLERRTCELREEVLSMEQEKRKDGIEEVARVAQIKGLQGMIADLQTERKVIGAKAASLFIVTAAVKENASALKEQVLAQIKAREADSQKLQDHLLRWLQDDVGKLQERNGELSTEAESKAQKLQKLQSEIHAIQQIVIELESKNLILKDESERRIKEHCDATTRIVNITNEKTQLESENRLLKEELDRAKDEALQLQEEGRLLKDDLQLQVTEVEALKTKLDNARQVAMHVSRLLEMIIGSEQQHESLSTATFQFAEEKLKQIYHVLLCLKDENERLKDDASQMAAKVDKLEDILCMKDDRSILDEPTQSHVHNSNLQQDSQQFEAKNCTLQGASLSETNENVEEHLQLMTEYNSHFQNEVSSQKGMFLEGFDTNGLVPDVSKEEQLPQMEAALDDFRGSNNFINLIWENGNALNEFEALREKYIMLEDEVQELREKTTKCSILSDAKPKEAQNLGIELKEMQSPTLVSHAKSEDMQDLQAQIQELQGIVQDLQKENIKSKGECPDGKTLKFKEELSHIEEPASTLMLEEVSLALQEEKEVVVDEIKSSANGIHNKVGQEIDHLQKGNRKYWRRLNSATQQVEGLQNTIQDLQQKLWNLKQENKKVKDDQWTGIEYSTIEKELRKVQEELLQLLEHYNELEKDVKYGFSSVNRIQEEMGSLKGVHSEDTNEEIDPGKLYEEIRILQGKNSKIADKLQAGSEKARGLEFEVRRIRLILLRFQEELEGLKNGHGAFIEKVRVPLRTFLGKKEHVQKRRACCACMQPTTHE